MVACSILSHPRLGPIQVRPAIDAEHARRGRPDATMRDLILAIRMDEANHRDVNHTFAGLKPNDTNPMLKSH
jgi:hypothetical protein